MNQQRMEETLVYQKKQDTGKMDLDDDDLAKRKGWAQREDVKELHAF